MPARIWMARDCNMTADPKVEIVADEYGAEGVLVFEECLAIAKLARDGGRLADVRFSTLAKRAYTTPRKARAIVELAAEVDLLTLDQVTAKGFSGQVGKHSRWQVADPGAADRKAAQRDRESRESHGDVTDPDRDESVKVTGDSRQEQNTEKTDLSPGGDVRRVFDAWIEATGRTGRTQLDDKRKRLIRKALASYPLDEVLDAVKGWRHSPHHRGENDRATVFNDLELLLRDSKHIENFRNLERDAAKGNGGRSRHQAEVERTRLRLAANE